MLEKYIVDAVIVRYITFSRKKYTKEFTFTYKKPEEREVELINLLLQYRSTFKINEIISIKSVPGCPYYIEVEKNDGR